jgi:hypothetical protein
MNNGDDAAAIVPTNNKDAKNIVLDFLVDLNIFNIY